MIASAASASSTLSPKGGRFFLRIDHDGELIRLIAKTVNRAAIGTDIETFICDGQGERLAVDPRGPTGLPRFLVNSHDLVCRSADDRLARNDQ